MTNKMTEYVIKRNGTLEEINLNKIIVRIKNIANEFNLSDRININNIAIDTMTKLHDRITTKQIDEETCKSALSKYMIHRDYERLATYITISSHIKEVRYLTGGNLINGSCELLRGVLAPNVINCFLEHKNYFELLMDEKRNYRYKYSGFFILKDKFYLLRDFKQRVIETPDFMTMRISIGIVAGLNLNKFTEEQLDMVKNIYLNLSSHRYTHATPTLLNSGTIHPQLASCALLNIDDNIDSIGEYLKTTLKLQKHSYGIGVSLTSLRSNKSHIRGTNGITNGIMPLAKIIDSCGYYIDQGGGKRPGSISPYIACWHPDLLDTLFLRTPKDRESTIEHHRLFYAVWICDYFMECMREGGMWYFFSSDDCPDLVYLIGEDFKKKYLEYVKLGMYRKSMPCKDVWYSIINTQAMTGVPYLVNKDTINKLRNQNDFIHSSNLCAEITVPAGMYFDKKTGKMHNEIGICNLASISMKKYFKKCAAEDNHKYKYYSKYFLGDGGQWYYFNEEQLATDVKYLVKSLNLVIDNTFYAHKDGEYSNLKRRPMGIGISSLADTLCKLRMVFGSYEACELRAQFQESLYWYAIHASAEEAEIYGPHEDYDEYKAAAGLLHPILFEQYYGIKYKQRYDWKTLSEEFKSGKKKLRNSVLTCAQPTGTTANIMGNSACFEPYDSNIYRFSAYAKELLVINNYIYKDLEQIGLLNNEKFMNRFIMLSGKLGDLKIEYFTKENIDIERFKQVYRVASYEISPKEIIDMAAAAQPYIDQSQSMNLYMPKISINTFNIYYYGYKRGLKTLVYYTKTQSDSKEKVCEFCI